MPRLALSCLALALFGGPALAARPMITDDARIVDKKACQVESWLRLNRDSRELWALPACTPVENFEVTVGGGADRADDGSRTTDVVIQGKTLLKPLETNGYGAGLVVGTVRHPAINAGSNQLGDIYAYVPASLSLASDRVVLHANLGALRSSEDRRNHATWGLSSEMELNRRVHVITETFGPATGKSYVQLGFRYWLVPDRMQVDATWGERLHGGGSERWYTLGLRILTPAFLP